MRSGRRSVALVAALVVLQVVALVLPATAAEFTVERLSGGNRFATAAEVSRTQYPEGAFIAFIATGAAFPDALTISAAAAGAGPVLLVERDRLPDETAAELRRLSPVVIIVIGGPNAVSDRTMIEVARLSGRETRRIAGSDRFATAAAISREAFDPGVPVAFVATGHAFQDAMVAAPAAAGFGGPVLLTAPDTLPAATEGELRRLEPERIVVVGGPNAVSDAVVERLRGLGGEVTRVGVDDDAATSAAVSRTTFTSSVTAFLATSADFPDGLTGSAFAGALPAPLMLVRRDSIPDAVKCELLRLGAEHVIVLGGTGAVGEGVVRELETGFTADEVPGCPAPS